MSASALAPNAANCTPLFGAPKPVYRISTDDMLDMKLPLKSLTREDIQNAYVQKMQGNQTAFNQKVVAPKQTGIDIDSLLDKKFIFKTQNTQAIHRITTNDLLDMQFPLKSLSKQDIQNAYIHKMKGKTITLKKSENAPKQQGIDIDSLLD